MAKLWLHRNILKNFHKLPSKVQKRISDLVDEFQHDPYAEAIGLHPLKETMLDPKVRGVKKLPDGYRAIVIAPEKGDTYLLVHVDTHDEAYAWARNKRFEVHEMTGVFQVFDAEEVQSIAKETPSAIYAAAKYPISRLNDDELFMAGVPKPLIPAVRSIHSDEGLESLSDYLPADCRDVLFGLAAGMSLDEALTQMLGASVSTTPATAGPGDFSKIEEAPNYDLVLVEGQEELKKILAGTLEEWRIFLHPSQRKLVNWKAKGPISITGAAGTGKTVALMHRAARLARELQERSARVLVTTYTTNLSITIKHHLQRLAPEVAERIEVTNLHALARTICSRAGWKGRIAEDDELDQIWEEVWVTCSQELPMSREQLRLEYEQVIEPNGLDEEEQYLTAVRSGRPRINREQRRAAWTIFRTFTRGLKKRNLLTFEGAIHQARLAVEQGSFTRYAHVLVDETQDFSLEALRLICVISPTAAGTFDPLCTVGDGHQRIYRHKVPLSRAGIDVRGRARRLKINYRTSQQIRNFAHGILAGLEIDDLDGGVVATTGDHSAFNGPKPTIQKCKGEKDEAETIVAWVKLLMEKHKLATHHICITPYKSSVRAALTAAGIATYELKPREEDPGSDEAGVRLGMMKRIKGLEFRAVAMACADPYDAMNDLEQAELRDRCERYVAATRAREYLLITIVA